MSKHFEMHSKETFGTQRALKGCKNERQKYYIQGLCMFDFIAQVCIVRLSV